MLKEIFEQPTAARETILGRVSQDTGKVFLEEMKITEAQLAAVERVTILACGTSWHAGLVGKFLIEQLARIPVEVDYGSEYRYRDPIVRAEHAARSSSRSRARRPTRSPRCAKPSGTAPRSIAICNVVGSMATRETDGTVYTHAGPEIGVASTKAFTSQLVALYLLALRLGQVRGALTRRGVEAARRRAAAAAAAPRADAEARARDRGDRRALPQPRRFPVPRPRHQLPDRARRRAEAEGDLVHPRRGLSGRRDEARPDRAHRRADAGRRDRAARPRVREDDRQHAGGEGARRLRHRAHDARRRQARRDPRPFTDFIIEVPRAPELLTPILMVAAAAAARVRHRRAAAAATSISRGISRRASRSSRVESATKVHRCEGRHEVLAKLGTANPTTMLQLLSDFPVH